MMDTPQKPKARAFSFGQAEVIDRRNQLFDYDEVCWNGLYWEPRFDLRTLGNLLHKTPYHESAIDAKTNILLTTIKLPKKSKIRPEALKRLMKDYQVFGHCYPLFKRNRWGELLAVEHLPALAMRRGGAPDQFLCLHNEQSLYSIENTLDYTRYEGNVLHLKNYDLRQEIYGVPSYLGALDAAWLNREATLLRRRFYNNGAHLGGVFILTAADIADDDVDDLEEQILAAKGVGNFKNLFMHLPGEEKEAFRFVPVGDIAAKDDFWNIKVASRNDVLAQHRVPLVLMSIMPETTSGLGKPQDAAVVFAKNEVEPLHLLFEEINRFAGETVMEFVDYALPIQSDASTTA